MDVIERARLVALGANCHPKSAAELDGILIAFALKWKAWNELQISRQAYDVPKVFRDNFQGEDYGTRES
ncbi:hypothetical protein LCGC14_0527630 [marine sediment metagenome]|uniref:Uncharacterized protein n=1 Tax=marine sediment metagenome TaxID=412755 RepID=A0A0F9SF32_9ZZZZ